MAATQILQKGVDESFKAGCDEFTRYEEYVPVSESYTSTQPQDAKSSVADCASHVEAWINEEFGDDDEEASHAMHDEADSYTTLRQQVEYIEDFGASFNSLSHSPNPPSLSETILVPGMSRWLGLPMEAMRLLRDHVERMSPVQIVLLLLWVFAIAIRRVCDSTMEVCVWLWCLLQHREGSTQGVEQGSSSHGGAIRISDAGSKNTTETYWQHIVEHPEEWWGNRATRRNPRAPDFKHRITQKALWIDNVQTPIWARARFQN